MADEQQASSGSIDEKGNPKVDAPGSIDKGMFDFNSVMKEFYNYKPGKDDTEGRAIKNNFQANMVQSGFDASLAKDMAQQQSSIAQSNMITAADLEQRNTASNMQQEFNYGMQSMGSQFEFQNKYANNQYNRDLGTLTATGEQQRLGQETAGEQNRLTSIVQGEQARLAEGVRGEYNVMGQQITADANKYSANQQAGASKYGADKTAQSSMYGADKGAQASMYGAD